MADPLIRCPACDHELRLPVELFGKTVECPQCGTRFTSPVPDAMAAPPVVRAAEERGPAYADDIQALQYRAGNSLRTPAVILLVLSGINLFMNGYSILTSREMVSDPDAFEVQMHQEIDRQPNLKAEQRDMLKSWFSADMVKKYSQWILICPGILTVAALITVIGCVQMLRLRAYGLCVLGCILALNPLNCPCCLLEVPFAIWGLVVLLNSDVRRAFS